jgi:hypothetical protein
MKHRSISSFLWLMVLPSCDKVKNNKLKRKRLTLNGQFTMVAMKILNTLL